ncbi:MAG TPA: hypothetical protein VIS96_01460 [Terrimicrobiaceae bacterium]
MASSVADETLSKEKFLSRVTAEVIRKKFSRIEGGDWDDHKDRISFKIKLRNGDPNLSFDGLRLELFIFGQSMVDQKALKLLQRATQSFSLAPLKEFEFESPEIVSMWDNTGAIFGEKYKGWYLQIYGPDGELLIEKNAVSLLTSTKDLPSLTEGSYYNKKLEPIAVSGPSGKSP